MADGTSGSTGADSLAQREADIAKLKSELVTAQKRVDDAQEMINRQSGEIGDDRKAIKESAEQIRRLAQDVLDATKALKKTQDDLAQAQGELAKVKQGQKTDEGNTRKTVAEEIEELSKGLSEDDLKALDAARSNADAETQKAIDAGGKVYLELLKGLKESQVAAKADLPPWRRSTPAQAASSGDDLAKKVRSLFKTVKKSAEYTPDGPQGGTPRAGRIRRLPTEGHPKATWVHE